MYDMSISASMLGCSLFECQQHLDSCCHTRLCASSQAVPNWTPALVNTAGHLCYLLTWSRGQHRQTVTATLSSTLWCHMQNLKYFVDAPSKAKSDNQSSDNPAKLELLKGITGYSAPGVLTALMGGSGQSPPCCPPPPTPSPPQITPSIHALP